MNPFKTDEELRQFLAREVLITSEALELLWITRQALNTLAQNGKLKPIKEFKAVKLFLRSEVEARKKEAAELKKKYRPYD